MKYRRIRHCIAGAALLLIAPFTHANLLNYAFEYELLTGEVLSGLFSGELQSDLDTVLVSNVTEVTFSGFPNVEFKTQLYSDGDFIANITSLSGTAISFSTAFVGASTARSFAFATGTPVSPLGTVLIVGDGGSAATTRLEFIYDPQRWSLGVRADNPVSAPSVLALIAIGLIAFQKSRGRVSPKELRPARVKQPSYGRIYIAL